MQEPIELVSCPRGGKICDKRRSKINEGIIASRKYFQNKEYNESINELKTAFNHTNHLEEPKCQQCVELFQSTIILSMEGIQHDLQKMTTGIFGSKQYQSSLNHAKEALEELRDAKNNDE